MCLRHGIGTGQEQDCAWGNGMDIGTGMKTSLQEKEKRKKKKNKH
jgi:hypothetical protein